ncbi:MAG: hypothetical protein WC551_05850 [Patescibacteria group bacterium]
MKTGLFRFQPWVGPVLAILAVQAFALTAFAQEADKPTEIHFSAAYLLGTLAAIVYKMAVGSAKHLAEKDFRFRALIVPIIGSVFLSFPLVFIVMPKFGKPTGLFFTDFIYTYLTTYALIDMTADYFSINDIVKNRLLKAADKDARRSHPPDEPTEENS